MAFGHLGHIYRFCTCNRDVVTKFAEDLVLDDQKEKDANARSIDNLLRELACGGVQEAWLQDDVHGSMWASKIVVDSATLSGDFMEDPVVGSLVVSSGEHRWRFVVETLGDYI